MEQLVNDLNSAIANSQWGLVAAAALMLFVQVAVRFFGKNVPSKWKPLFSSLVGVMTSVAAVLAAGGSWLSAISTGVLLGTSAGGQWSLWGKYVLRPRVPRPKPV